MRASYNTNEVSLTFIANGPTSWVGYSLDSQSNVTVSGNTTITDLADRVHNLVVYARDTQGNSASSEVIHFSIETDEPEQEPEPQQTDVFPTTWVVVIAAAVIAAVMVAIFLLRFKKKKEANA